MAEDLEDVRRRLYRCIVVQHLIQTARNGGGQASAASRDGHQNAGSRAERERPGWHDFIDGLSTLCDYLPRGRAVVSVAVEDVSSTPVFWITANSGDDGRREALPRARDHLMSVLELLRDLTRRPENVDNIEDEILSRSVSLAHEKVEHYRRRIRDALASRGDQMRTFSPDEEGLLDEVSELISPDQDTLALCIEAYGFRRTPAARRLARKARLDPRRPWPDLWHYVGRLGSWSKATATLSLIAADFTAALENHVVRDVPLARPGPLRPLPPMWDLTDLFPVDGTDGLDISAGRLRSLFGPEALEAVDRELRQFESRGWHLKLHAEAAMAHFFASERKRFFRDDRYIGCSKGSCTCCDAFLELHPGGFARRPCHGNTWIQWGFPGLSDPPSEDAARMLRRVTARMVDEVRREFVAGLRGHAFTTDSNTDMSSVLRALTLSSR